MNVKINGKNEAVNAAAKLSEIISQKGLCAEKIVVEYNWNIIPKDGWPGIILKENDNIEIVSFVSGG